MPIFNTASETEKRYTDEQTDNRNHEHLLNEQDSISEADIRNVKTDESITEVKHVNDDQKPGSTETDIANEDRVVKDNEDPEIGTPWNILDPEAGL